MTGLKFTAVPVRSADPIQRARETLNSRLGEQAALAKDPGLTRARKKGKGAERVTVQLPITPWWTTRPDGRVIFVLKVGGKRVTALEIPSMDEFAAHIASLSKAISAGDLDQYLIGGQRKPITKKATPKPLPVKGRKAA